MPYQVAYDVLDDGYHVGFAWLGVPLGALIFVLAVLRPQRAGWRVTFLQSRPGGPWVGVAVGGLIVAIFAAVIAVSLWDQAACRRDAKGGECSAAEGEITQYQKLKTHTEFTVAGAPFKYHRRSPAFRGKFTVPDPPIGIWNGARVRVVYCGENILRIEYPAP